MFGVARRPVTLRLYLHRRARPQWGVHTLLGHRDDDDSPSVGRWQATMTGDCTLASIAQLRSRMHAITSPKRAKPAVAKVQQIAQITRAFPGAAAKSDSVRELADLCRLLAQAQPRHRRGKHTRVKGQRWYDAALDRCLVLLQSSNQAGLDARDLSTLAHALSLLPMQFNSRDVELVNLLGQNIATSVAGVLEGQEAIDQIECKSWDGKAVATAMNALAKLSVRHEPAMLALTRLAHRLEPTLDQRATSTIIWSLAILDCVEEPYITVVDSLGKKFCTAVCVIDSTASQGVLRGILALAQQMQRPGSLDRARRASVKRDRRDDEPTSSTRKGSSTKRSMLTSRPAPDVSKEHIKTIGCEWASLRTAVVLAWSLTVLDRLSFPVLRAVFAVVAAAEKRGELKNGKVNDIVLCQLHQVILAMELGHVSGSRATSSGSNRGRSSRQLSALSDANHREDINSQNGHSNNVKTESMHGRRVAAPSRLAARCRATFRRINKKVGHSSQYSPTAAAVGQALALARPESKVEREQLLHDCSYSVDFLLREERIAVEVDGKVHFCRSGPWEEEHTVATGAAGAESIVGHKATRMIGIHPSTKVAALPPRRLGRTVLKHRQIEANGWRVVAVPWWEWELLKGGGAPVRYLARKTCGVGAAPCADEVLD